MLLDCSHLPTSQVNDTMEFLCKGVEDHIAWDPHPTDRLMGAVEDLSTGWVVQALTQILGEAMTAFVAGSKPLAKAKADEGNASLGFRCKELEQRLRGADPGSLGLPIYLEVIDCWLLKYLPPAITEQTAKRRAIQQYLAGFLREDILNGTTMAPKTTKDAQAVAVNIPDTMSRARARWASITPLDEARIAVAQISAARYVQHISEDIRSRMAKVIINAEKQRIGEGLKAYAHQPLAQALQDQFAELNFDWRRIAVSESAINASDGYLSTLALGEKVKWLAHPGACRYCEKQNGKVFAVVGPDAPRKDPQTQVWVGKHVMNIGRSISPRRRLPDGEFVERGEEELVVPMIPAHPVCRCLWIPFVPSIQSAQQGVT